MPLKKSLQKITIKEMEEILKSLENKFTQNREEFENFLPEITPIFDNIHLAKRKNRSIKTPFEKKEKTETTATKRFTLIDEFLTEKEKKVRYDNAIKAIHKFREGENLTVDEMKKSLVNAALVDFKKQANPEDIETLNQIVGRLLGIPLMDETEKQVVYINSAPTKKYELTHRINIHLNRDFSLVKIEILKASSE